MARRELLKRSSAVGLGVVGAGVLSGGGVPAIATVRAQEPVSGGELGLGLPIEPSLLDPHAGSSRYDAVVLRMVFDSLVHRTDDGDFVPHLATGWETSDDGLAWTFTLRDDVTFHDGTPFDAKAAKISFDRMVDPATASQAAAGQLGPFTSAEVIDDHTLQMNFSEPFAAFLNNLSDVWLTPESPAAIEKFGADIGTNPSAIPITPGLRKDSTTGRPIWTACAIPLSPRKRSAPPRSRPDRLTSSSMRQQETWPT
jgi:peptide/nickel transport system substrate-binding protein